MGVIIRNICQYCGTDIDAEEEVFSGDKLFKGHSCQMVKLLEKALETNQMIFKVGED